MQRPSFMSKLDPIRYDENGQLLAADETSFEADDKISHDGAPHSPNFAS